MKTITCSIVSLGIALLLAPGVLAQTNYFAGTGAGFKNTSSTTNNTFVGYFAGYNNTSGAYNAFFGGVVGYSNTTGWYNSFVGYQAGYSNTTGTSNSFVGYRAGYRTTTGVLNSFFGRGAGFNNTTGRDNSFFGANAGYSNTTASGNSAFGYNAGFSNTTGSGNSIFGYQAGYFTTTGGGNSFFGDQAGYRNTTGMFNSFSGGFTGFQNTTGSYNSFTGYSTGYANTTGNNNSFFGYSAGGATTTGSNNTFSGYFAGSVNTTGSGNTALGFLSGPASANLTNANAIGFRARVTASNALILGAIQNVNGATAHTNVGIGTTAPSYRLHVNGMAAKPGTSTWIVASDKRLKQDITQFSDGLAVLSRIRPVKFRYNGKADLPQDKEFIGVIAQEVQSVAPYMISTFTYADTTGKQEEYLDYDASALTYVLVNAVNEQQQLIADKDAHIQQLEEKISLLESRLGRIEQLLKEPGAISNSEESLLWQNSPNPYTQTTIIKYRIPASAASAHIRIYAANGQELHQADVTGNAEGELILSGGQFPAGTYVYSLFVDGRRVASKKMVLLR